ncbi:unnamed protein product, partial [Rotaria sp. Silwood2]
VEGGRVLLFRNVLPESEATQKIQQEALFDNNYSEQLGQESNETREEFNHGPEYDVNWIFINKEKARVVFSLFSMPTVTNETNFFKTHDNKTNIFPTMLSITPCTLQSIYSLTYFRFAVREYKTNTTILPMTRLNLTHTPSRPDGYFSNSLLLVLDPKEKYSVCIYYYQLNISTQMPDLFICLYVMDDHLKHSAHGLIFVLTQYSIILGLLIVLQGLFTVRKRRFAHIVHQLLINKAQRLRSTLSSVSLVRQSTNLMDTTTEQKTTKLNGHVNQEKNKLKKRIISSPAIVLIEPTMQSNMTTSSSNENESCLKLTSGKNHVHFLLGLDEESDENNDDDDNNDNDNDVIPNDTILTPPIISIHMEPYGDQSNALLSMAHILDTNKPWSKQS